MTSSTSATAVVDKSYELFFLDCGWLYRHSPAMSYTLNPKREYKIGNSKLGTEALAELVRKVVEDLLETKVKEIRETFQVGCFECKKRKNHSPQRIAPCSVKHVKTRPNFLTCKNCNGRHPGECHRKKGVCPRCGSREHQA
ncbi:hypothetical protein J1N35_034486 [Gossypium stocksii]|uniref:Uncharacterized protein n=1 Tax=Gossypium stocksii TaxID=47602 RepID=A0A9D3ZPA0_9ROSI|nr:hypothetical protein J1N35_034486 [Gossypium stocksii]